MSRFNNTTCYYGTEMIAESYEHVKKEKIRRTYYPNEQLKSKTWYRDGKVHREDGPALVSYYENGSKKAKYGIDMARNIETMDRPLFLITKMATKTTKYGIVTANYTEKIIQPGLLITRMATKTAKNGIEMAKNTEKISRLRLLITRMATQEAKNGIETANYTEMIIQPWFLITRMAIKKKRRMVSRRH